MIKISNQWLLFTTLLFIGVALLVGVPIILQGNATKADIFTSDAEILYLVPNELEVDTDIPDSESALGKLGVKVVHNFRDLQIAFEESRLPGVAQKSKIGAIILHQQSLPEVDSTWLQGAFEQGLVLAGVNIKTSELAHLLGDDSLGKRGWADDQYKIPFYSYLGRKAGSWGGVIASGNNNLNPEDASVEQFIYALRIAMKNLENAP